MLRRPALLLLAAILVACGFCFQVSAKKANPAAPGAMTADEERVFQAASEHADDLWKQGYVVYYVPPGEPTPVEFFLLQSDASYTISLWFQTAQGEYSVELRDPAGQAVASTQAWQGDLRLEHPFAAGKYLVFIRPINGARVHGVIGIKGAWALTRCPTDKARLIERPADPPRYYSPYLLVKPAGRAADTPASGREGALLVVPNNTGLPVVDAEALRASAICELAFNDAAGPLAIADGLGTPLLMPLFPRPEKPYLHSLTRDSLLNQSEPRFNRVDKQLIAMIDDARALLRADMNYQAGERVLMQGFSASGVFTGRFALLHPERVLAAAAGGPGGWLTAPVPADQGKTLPYPVGIADLGSKELGGQPVDLAALRHVRFLFLLGDADTNDSVPCLDSFSETDAVLINTLFGPIGGKCMEGDQLKRWWHAQRLYDAARVNAQFRIYPGVDHKMTPAMRNDVLDMFRKALAAH